MGSNMPTMVEWVNQTVVGTPGTGTITLGNAVDSSHIRLQDDPRITDGAKVLYTAEDSGNRENGIGTYTATGTLLSRDTISAKLEAGVLTRNPGTGLTLSSNTKISITGIVDSIGILVGRQITRNSNLINTSTPTVSVNDNKPTSSEGVEIATVTYTPKFPDSILKVRANVGYYYGDSLRLFQLFLLRDADTTSDFVSVGLGYSQNHDSILVEGEYLANGITSTTFKVRGGVDGGTSYVNGAAGARRKGGAVNTFIEVLEYRQN